MSLKVLKMSSFNKSRTRNQYVFLDNVVMNYLEKKEEEGFEKNYIDFEKSFSSLGLALIDDLQGLAFYKKKQNFDKVMEFSTRIYFKTPFLITSALNYKITVENDLEMHSSKYVDLNSRCCKYSKKEKIKAHRLFVDSINISKEIFYNKKTPRTLRLLDNFLEKTPEKLRSFIYTSDVDIYTYLASHPSRLKKLSEQIRKKVSNPYLLSTAHGGILGGLSLSSLLNCDVYFLRFSKYKREDDSPIISSSDLREIKKKLKKDKTLILFDEDLASGETIRKFKEEIEEKVQKESKAASVLLSYNSKYIPDFFADQMY